MEMIDLSRLEPQGTLNHTSKGNQLKWKCYGYWYKAGHMGYEGLAETIVSALLGKSTVKYPFVAYEYSQIKYKERIYRGCKSADFLADGYDLIPLEKLYRKFTGGSLAVDTAHQGEITDQIKFLVNFVEQTTGLQEFGRYLTSMLEIDAFFLNEDRHTNNIAVQYNAADNTYALCPLFDNGLSLLADTNMDFPLERSLEDCLKAVQVPSNRSDARFLLSPVTHSKRCTHLYSEALILSSLLAYRCDLRRFPWLFLSHDRIFLDKFCPILYTLECRG